MVRSTLVFALVVTLSSCASAPEPESSAAPSEVDYCAVEGTASRLEIVRPAEDEPPIDDVNWFARPVPNFGNAWVVGFASHDQNYLYDLGTGQRVKIPDRSDAVATPDGLYMTVPSYYTPDEYIRFYDALVLMDHLERGEDADHIEPVFIHEHEDLRKVYYQSTAIVDWDRQQFIDPNADVATTYRLMFSGTASESGFRIVDYLIERSGGKTVSVRASEPMKLCPEIENDLNTPFISKDARYVASYTSTSEESEYSPGASLKVYEITRVRPAEGTTTCREVVDFGFAAGKADFSFDNSQLTFHISQGGYLTPFVNGGLPEDTTTDVVVVDLELDRDGDITGAGDMRRLTTSLTQGVGSYFPAFFPDGNLYYIANSVPKESDADKRFHFKVTSTRTGARNSTNPFLTENGRRHAKAVGQLWHDACGAEAATLKEHEIPWIAVSLDEAQCTALIEAHWKEGLPRKESLAAFCSRAS